tara:strand:+ start:241 stop:1035 length:795 start_codon:yes stop_codon:yes gene_type:complete
MSSLSQRIKGKLFLLFELINPMIFHFIAFFYKMKNKILKKRKVLVFTDSRGFEVTKFWNRKNPFSSYVGGLIRNFDCTYLVCPEKFTSLLDFLEYCENNEMDDYENIILHCGIVDFAPRPESSYDKMFRSKTRIIKKFGFEDCINKIKSKSGPYYDGELTYSFFNDSSLSRILSFQERYIKKIIYISINPVLNDWSGNYWRKRPDNINSQLELDNVLKRKMTNIIDLSSLSKEEIMKFTSDNVHYTKEGFKYIYNKLSIILQID